MKRLRRLGRQFPALARRYFHNFPLDPFPLRHTIRNYSKEKFRADFGAGLNGALLAFPQGMAYALIAGLPIQYGLYTCALAALIGPLFASSRFTILGPTNATSILILSSYLAMNGRVDKLLSLSLLLLLMGLFLVIGSFLKLANLTQYVSRSVVVGYITGAACLIIVNQLHDVLGYPLTGAPTFIDVLGQTLVRLPQTHLPSLTLGVLTLAMWFFFKKRFPKLPGVALTLVLMTLANLVLPFGWQISRLDALPFGTWPLTAPTLNFTWINQLTSLAVALAFFAVLEGSSIAKSLANRAGDKLDGNQDMLSLGVANVACAFFGGMPCSGSLTRSALNWASGAVTALASVWGGLLCILALLLLGPLIGYIPVPTLAVLVICVGFSLFNRSQIRIVLRSTRSDAAVFLTTWIAALLTPLDIAIYLGIGLSIALYLRKASQPKLVEYAFDAQGQLEEKRETKTLATPHVSIIHVEGELFFGASELFRDQIRQVCADPSLQVLVLRLKNARHLDASSVMALEELARYLRETGRHLLISGASREIYRTLRDSGVLAGIGQENLFLISTRAPNLSTRKALQRAQYILGKSDAPVRIFYDPKDLSKK